MNLIQPVWGDASKWPYIAYLKMYFPKTPAGGFSVGTGALIHPRILLTAGHVVYDPEQGTPQEGNEAKLAEIRFGGPGPSGLTCYSRQFDYPTQWRDHDSHSDTSEVSAFDCGAIFLDQPVDRSFKPMQFSTASDGMLAGTTLSVAGYPAFYPPLSNDNPRGTICGAQFNLVQGSALPPDAVGRQKYRLFYPVQTYPGMSGGPVYGYDESSGVRTIYGIHTSLPAWIGLGSALRINDNILGLIKGWVAATPNAP